MFNSIINFFVPKDKVFFKLFEQVAINSDLMAEKLSLLASEPNFNNRNMLFVEISKLEHENDNITHEIFVELGRNFITPLDREDIHYLAKRLDDVADFIHSSAKRIVLYKIDPTEDTGIQKMVSLIKQATEQIKIIILELRKLKKMQVISDAIIKINSFENQADDIYDLSIERLFDTETNFKELIKKREIYNVLEIATDKCEDAANVVESILIKYS